jgi:hypothetical protein
MDMYLESENEENDDIILNDNDIDFEYDNEAFKTYKKIFFYKICIAMIQVMMKTSYQFNL